MRALKRQDDRERDLYTLPVLCDHTTVREREPWAGWGKAKLSSVALPTAGLQRPVPYRREPGGLSGGGVLWAGLRRTGTRS